MFISDISVKRPVFAIVVNLLFIAFGVLAYTGLPVREYPDIDPPIVSVEISYPGASAEVVETRITQVVEDSISGLEGIKTIQSRSRDGRCDIDLEFITSRDVDAAANDVRDRVSRVADNLPEEAEPPEIVKVDSDASVIMWLNLSSPNMTSMELTDYAQRYLQDRLSVIDGVARVRLGGRRDYSMRVWLDREALAARSLTVEDVENALRSENVELPAGRVESLEREFTARMKREYQTAEDFSQMVIAKGGDGYLVRLGDVARVEVGPESDRTDFRGNGEPMIGLGIVRQSTANTLDVTSSVKEEVVKINQSLPNGMQIYQSYDTSIFIEEAIYEVFKTLLIAIGLVVLVIFLFLGSARATLIPAVTVPVSLTGSMIALSAFGFSINLLTLLALVLAIGLVVDDSIVVLENIYRRIELGEPPLLAAYRGAREVGFAVVATTMVLVAVFVPLAYMEGNIGRLFSEFALALAAAVCFSSIVALTLSPVMAAWFLKPVSEKKLWLVDHIDRGFDKIEDWYIRSVKVIVRFPLLIGAGIASTVVCIMILVDAIPRELAPQEDRGAFFIIAKTPEGSSFQHALREMRKVEADMLPLISSGEAMRILARVPASFGGDEVIDGGRGIVLLEHWNKRERSTEEIMTELREKFSKHPGVKAFPVMRRALGGGAGQSIEFVIGGPTYDDLVEWRDIILEKAASYPGLTSLDSDYEETKPKLNIAIDRERAADLGVSVRTVGRTLETMLGKRRVTTYIDDGEEYDVILEAEDEDKQSFNDLSNIYVRSERSSQLIPLSNIVRLEESADAPERRRYNRFRAITISANLTPGYKLGEALDFLETTARESLPATAVIDYKGESREYKEAGDNVIFVFALSLLVVFLVLAAQFESFIHPVIIILTVPLAVAGALLGLFSMGSTLNIYSQIGIVMLIGLAAKNGILIVEFANQLRDEGYSFDESLFLASKARLRPICMTGVSTMFGAVPLVLATGAGSESRATIGITILFGVAFSTALTLYVIPTLYYLMGRLTRSPQELERELNKLSDEVPNQV